MTDSTTTIQVPRSLRDDIKSAAGKRAERMGIRLSMVDYLKLLIQEQPK